VGRGLLAALENSNEIQKLDEKFKLKGSFKKLALISGSNTNSDISDHATFRQFKSRISVPLRVNMCLIFDVAQIQGNTVRHH